MVAPDGLEHGPEEAYDGQDYTCTLIAVWQLEFVWVLLSSVAGV